MNNRETHRENQGSVCTHSARRVTTEHHAHGSTLTKTMSH